jgi:hypothetical protein
MRTIVGSILLTLCLFNPACSKRKDNMEGAANAVEQRRDNVKEQRLDVAKEHRELNTAEGDLTKARLTYEGEARKRLADLDVKISELEAKAATKSRESASMLRERRTLLVARLDQMGTTTAATWETVKNELEQSFSSMEKDVQEALKL